MEELEIPCCIQEYHVYQEVWTASGMYGPRFLLLSALAFGSDFAIGYYRAIAYNGINSDKGPLGLGRPSFGLKQVRINIANSNQVVVATRGDTFLIAIACTGRRHKCMRNFSHCKCFAVEHNLFQVFNFRIPLHIRKFFNAKSFPKLQYTLINKEL